MTACQQGRIEVGSLMYCWWRCDVATVEIRMKSPPQTEDHQMIQLSMHGPKQPKYVRCSAVHIAKV